MSRLSAFHKEDLVAELLKPRHDRLLTSRERNFILRVHRQDATAKEVAALEALLKRMQRLAPSSEDG